MADATTLPSGAAAACWLCEGWAFVDERYRQHSFYRCQSCGFLFAPERSTSELHGIYSDAYFDQYSGEDSYTEAVEQRRHEARLRLEWVASHVARGRLMEIGAADGTFLHQAQSAGFQVFGVEPAAGLAQRARTHHGVQVVPGFVESVDLPTDAFDVVCGWHVLEHIREPVPSLIRLRASLFADGLLFLEIPNIDSVRAQMDGCSWLPLKPDAHVAFYTPEQLSAVLGKAGFGVVHVSSVSTFSYLRPAVAWRPKAVAHRAFEAAVVRAHPGRSHPHKHELLRVVARPL